jgi:phosphotransferase system HPr (HPr) family protein
MSVCSAEVEVADPAGLHARPAAAFVALAATFSAAISVQNLSRDRGPTNAKSIIGVLGIGVSQGHRVRIESDGADAEAATRALAELIGGPVGQGDESEAS